MAESAPTLLQKHAGWFVIAGAVFMMLTLISVEIAGLESWSAVSAPAFVGKLLGHVGAVGAAVLGGKLLPQFPTPSDDVPSAATCPSCGQPIAGHEEHA